MVTNSTASIVGAACGSNNSTLLYELAASKKTNATSYSWWYGSGSANGITPVSGDASKAYLSTGNYFSAGQVCVGINYNVSPWYASYCVNVAKCNSARTDENFEISSSIDLSNFPNPFNQETVITLPDTEAQIQVFSASGKEVISTTARNEFKFGSELGAGIYFVKVTFEGYSQTLKVMKD